MKKSFNSVFGTVAAAVNVLMVALFAISMFGHLTALGYISSMFIAFSFVAMISAFAHFSVRERKSAAITAVACAAIYATIIILVYFAQLTTVRLSPLGDAARSLLDFKQFGLMFNYDLLGYGVMALSTFFAGLAIKAENRVDKWLKALLLIHGVFFPSCIIMPMLGIFTTESESSGHGGEYALIFWCAYFIPVGILSVVHFMRKKD